MTAYGAYTVIDRKMSQTAALSTCQMLGAHLAVTETQAEHDELMAALSGVTFTTQTNIWFGVTIVNDKYIWQYTGEEVTNGFVNWYTTPPSIPINSDSCSSLDNGSVYISACDLQYNVICEHLMG